MNREILKESGLTEHETDIYLTLLEHGQISAYEIAEKTGAKMEVLDNPKEAAEGADILYTDVWVSMGEEEEEETKLNAFQGYQINPDLLSIASKDARVMHCLPAHRGQEITSDVIEGPQSIVWQQAENKMHGAAGILDYFLS